MIDNIIYGFILTSIICGIISICWIIYSAVVTEDPNHPRLLNIDEFVSKLFSDPT